MEKSYVKIQALISKQNKIDAYNTVGKINELTNIIKTHTHLTNYSKLINIVLKNKLIN